MKASLDAQSYPWQPLDMYEYKLREQFRARSEADVSEILNNMVLPSEVTISGSKDEVRIGINGRDDSGNRLWFLADNPSNLMTIGVISRMIWGLIE